MSMLTERGFDLVRDLRTAALWLLGPADLVVRRLNGRGDLPPLWLRRHVGPVGAFESAARDMEMILRRHQLVRPADRILEIGCGCGAMIPAFVRLLGPEGKYVGFDVHSPSIRWCRRRFAADLRFRFELAEIASPYGDPSLQRPAQAYRFPLDDAAADFILAKSVFTHLLEGDARHYLREIRRTLRPGRLALITAFLFDGATRPVAFPFPDQDSPVRWLRNPRPQAAMAFDRMFFEGMIAEAGLTLRELVPGFWPGTAPVPRGQDVLVLGLPEL
jgi:ubiquinone/menaquinone biosynthesis C-methylase UbiE